MDERTVNKQYAEKKKSEKVVRTFFLVLVWVALGLHLEITGPTLIDLKIRTGADYQAVAVAVSGRSLGYFIGSAIGGLLVDKLVSFCDLMIGVCLTGGAVVTVFIPWAPMVELMWFIIVVQGTFEGVINIAGQKLIMMMWQEHSASPLNLLHGGFGIGSFIIPLIANPFLAVIKTPPMPNITMPTNVTMHAPGHSKQSIYAAMFMNGMVPGGLVQNGTNVTGTGSHTLEFIRESRIEYAYLVAALLTLALSAAFYIYHVHDIRELRSYRSTKRSDKIQTHEKQSRRCKDLINPASCANGNLLYGMALFCTLFIFYFNIVGGERILGKFIRAYSIEQLGFSGDDGSYINTAFWVSFAVGRLSGFFVARWIPIRILILIETGGVLIFSILLNIFATNSSLALWILIQPLALFHAPMFPSAMGWGNFHLEMSGMAICFLLLGGSLGGIAYLRLTGFLFQTYGPRSFLYHILGYGIAAFSLAVVLDLIGARHGSRFKQETEIQEEGEEMKALKEVEL